MKALGLLVFMLSKPNNWEFSQEALGRWFNEGREAMRSVMRNLADAGYVRREVTRGEGGQLRTITIVSEEPGTGFPPPADPPPADPPSGQAAPIVTTDPKKTVSVKTEEESLPGAAATKGQKSYPAEFEAAWGLYPKSAGGSKKAAFLAWSARLKEGISSEVLQQSVTRYAAYCVAERKEPRYVLHAATFFGPNERYAAEWPVGGTKSPNSKSIAGMNYNEGFDEHGRIL